MNPRSSENGHPAPDKPDRELALYREDGIIKLVLLEDGRPVEYLEENKPDDVCRLDIWLGRLIRTVEPLKAAFIDIGTAKHGMLPLAELDPCPAPGSQVLVQVRQLKTGDKGHLLTRKLQLPGPFAVCRPGALPKKRSQLKALPEDIRDKVYLKDLERLEAMWRVIEEDAGSGKVPRRLASFAGIIDQVLADFTGRELKSIHIQDHEIYESVHNRMREIMPWSLPLLRLHREGSYNLPELLGFGRVGREREKRIVYLDQGGSLAIDRTEALTVIDVNSGADIKGSPDNMRLRVNLQAAAEITRQLRLRNTGGIIIIDFIDLKPDDQQVLLARLHELSGSDRGRCRVLGFTRLGLLEMTRTPV